MIDGRRIAKTLAKTLAYFQKWFPAFAKGKRELRKIAPRGNTGGDVRIIAGPREGRRGLDEKLAARSTTLELKVVEASEPSLKSSTQIGQVGSEYQPCPARYGAMVGLRLPGRRCLLLRATSGHQHSQRADCRNFGAASMVGSAFSSDLIDLCSKHSFESIF